MNKVNIYRFLLLVLIVSLLTGCVTVPDSTTDERKPSVPILGDVDPTEMTTVGTEPTTQFTTQCIPETVDNPDGLPVLQWLCLETGRDNFQKLSQNAAVEINRMLKETGMPFRLQFVLCSTDSFETTDWFSIAAIQEALTKADLIYGKFTEDQAKQYLMPLTGHVDGSATPSLTGTVPHEKYWHLGKLGGEILGVPTLFTPPLGHGFSVDSNVLTDWGITVEDFAVPYWEMDSLFARIYEKNGHKAFLYDPVGDYKILTDPNTGNQYHENNSSVIRTGHICLPGSFYQQIMGHFQTVTSCFAIDFSSGKPTVVNYLETDFVRLSQAAMLRYRKAGYLTISDTTALMRNIFVYSDQFYLNEAEKYVLIPAEDPLFSAKTATPLNGISALSNHQEEALMLLSLIASDEAFRELLLFGVEGQDYTLTEAGAHMPIAQADGSSYPMSFLSPYSSLYGTGSDFMIPTQDGSTRRETYQATMDRVQVTCDITFNLSTIAAEVEAVNAILARQDREDFEKDPPIQFAIFGNLTETEYDQMLAEIRAAGGDKILAELQRQLDTWLAENPDWNN